ncbi:MAG: histidinol dehydrogenase, partial [Gammaproteobacteria bacterium HGW-Gammaproteobacteria-5]
MKRIDWSELDEAGRREALQRPTLGIADSVREGVQRIIAQVRADGDYALKALTRRFDGVELDSLQVSADEFSA